MDPRDALPDEDAFERAQGESRRGSRAWTDADPMFEVVAESHYDAETDQLVPRALTARERGRRFDWTGLDQTDLETLHAVLGDMPMLQVLRTHGYVISTRHTELFMEIRAKLSELRDS